MPTEPEIWAALDRLRSGPGLKGKRYDGLSLKVACNTMALAVQELIDLRHENRELLCVICQTVTTYSKEDWEAVSAMQHKTCVTCGTVLVVHAHAIMRAMRQRLQELEQQVERLEEVVTTAFSFE